MEYQVYDTFAPVITKWTLDTEAEVEEACKLIISDNEHFYFFQRIENGVRQEPERIDREAVSISKEDGETLLLLTTHTSSGKGLIELPRGCITSSSNGTAFLSVYNLLHYGLPSFLFHPEMRPRIF